MKELFDTSVLVASFWRGHRDHEASLRRVAAVYASVTALPVKDLIPPDQALLFVQEVRDRLSVIALNESEYYEAIQQAGERGFSSGRIYDALLLACAAKVKAEVIYTWNVKHFKAIDPKQAHKIQTP